MRTLLHSCRGLCAALCVVCHAFAADKGDWFDFVPSNDVTADSVIDLRWLNEPVAGERGFVQVRDGSFVLAGSGEPVRFWGVNGPSSAAKTPAELRRDARLLAGYGVNLVRVHGALYDRQGTLDPERVQRCIAIAEAMKEEGIYVVYSIYFPLWLNPKPDHPWLAGYNGGQHPFAALMFNPEFQQQYQQWWRALLLTPSRTTGRRLIDEPSVLGAEIQNEDSYFFWTFSDANLPEPQRAILERQFAEWLAARYGSPADALNTWGGERLSGDDPAHGRIAFRPLHRVFNERTPRDQDTVAFLLESQRAFYTAQSKFLRELGLKGLITCSNWTTASPEVLGPLEKYSYTVGDFVDRHGYHSAQSRGESAEWSIRDGHTYRDRSAYRFDAEDGSGGRLFVHPAMDPEYAGLPSMISETTWNRPNRFRSEAPLYFAAYGALQDTDAIVHFAFDGSRWSVKPNFWMQPWTLMSPAMMGQFPAAALIYRRGLVSAGQVLATVDLGLENLRALEGTPLAQDAALDELRLKDVDDTHTTAARTTLIDPLIHYAGRTRVNFHAGQTSVKRTDLSPYIDHAAQRVTSSTGELALDYGRGFLRINAPAVQGVSGLIGTAGTVNLTDIKVESPLELGHVVLVALDEKPVRESRRMLLQVMSEEKPSGFETATASDGLKTIRSIGTDPWRVRKLAGSVSFRQDAANLHVTALDLNGFPRQEVALENTTLRLLPETVYYLIERRGEAEPKVGAASHAGNTATTVDPNPVCENMSSAWTVSPSIEPGCVLLRVAAPKPACYLEIPLGRIAGLKRFTSGYRFVPFWMKPAIGTNESEVRAETQWLLAETISGEYILVAPLLDGATRFSLQGSAEGLVLVAETGDPTVLTSGGTALLVARGADPYALAATAARAISGHLAAGGLRANKPVPDFVDLFGWCTWDAFYQEVSPDNVRAGLSSFAAGGVEPRFMILDDGWQSVREGLAGEIRLASLAPNDRFHGDLAPLVRMAKDEFRVQRFLVWHALMGYWGGLDEETLGRYEPRTVARSFGPGILKHGATWNVQPWGAVLGVPAASKAFAFYDDYHRALVAQGVDAVKVDNQAMLEAVASGQGGRVPMARAFRTALERSVQKHFAGRLINCMSATTEAAYLTADSTVMRTSDDFWPRRPETHGAHVFINAHTSFWFGEFILPDWDMFQSAHPAGALHAAARAISGGPVYVSDKPGQHDFALLRKLVLSDGTVLRGDLPGRPTRECLFADPTTEPVLLKVFNRNHDSGVVGLFNVQYHADPSPRTVLTGRTSPSDVEGLAGTEFVGFAHRADRLWRCGPGEGAAFSLREGEWELVTYAPVERGFAALGLADKLNSSGAVTARRWEGEQQCTVELRDGGEFLGWADAAPRSVRSGGRELPVRYDAATGRLAVAVPTGGPRTLVLDWPARRSRAP